MLSRTNGYQPTVDEFQAYLKKGKVLETLSSLIESLYQEDEWPVCPLDYMRGKLGELFGEECEIEVARAQLLVIYEEMAALKAERRILFEENDELTKTFNDLMEKQRALKRMSKTSALRQSASGILKSKESANFVTNG